MHADIMITEEGDKESANIVLNTENYIQEEIYQLDNKDVYDKLTKDQ